MKNERYKPNLIIDGYRMKKQLHGGYKILEFSHYENESRMRKRTLYKNLDLSTAEDTMYRLEKSNY